MSIMHSGATRRAISQSRLLITSIMASKGIPGLSISVGVNGKAVWSEGFGFADIENGVKMTEDSLVRIGSISKMVTTLAAAKLMENGKLNIDEQIQQYLPKFPEKHWNGEKVTITTRHLMNHTSGLRHYRSSSEWNQAIASTGGAQSTTLPSAIVDAIACRSLIPGKALPPEFYIRKTYSSVLDAFELFQDDPLIFKTGCGFSYSSMGWILISAIIESLVEKNFTEHMRDILDDLGLEDTVIETNEAILLDRARFYTRDYAGNLINSPYIDVSWKAGSGGFMSTTGDLLKLAHIFLNSYWSNSDLKDQTLGYLKSKTVKQLWTRHPKGSDECGTYGLGCMSNIGDISFDPYTMPCHYILHTGRGVGFGAVVHITLEGEDSLSGENMQFTTNQNRKGSNEDHAPCFEEMESKERRAVSVAMLANLENFDLQQIGLKIATFF